MEIWSDHLEGTECERTETCEKGCKLYSYQFAYGSHVLDIGFGDFGWSYANDDETYGEREKFRRDFTRETKFMWDRDDIRPFLLKYEEMGAYHKLVPLCDYLTDIGKCPETRKVLKQRIKEEDARANR